MLTTAARWRWLVPVLVAAAILVALIPPRAPYIYGSGLSSQKVVQVVTETRWCAGMRTGADKVVVGAGTNVLFGVVNDDACSQRRAQRRGLAVGLLLLCVVLMRRRRVDELESNTDDRSAPIPTAP